MDLSGIISVSGMPGLYKVVGQMKNGVIGESLAEKKRVPIHSHQQISSLEDISMYTTGDNKPVSEIMQAIYDRENGGKCIDHKADEKEIIRYFETILPDYDKERVYVSNMRKLFNWYNLLQESGNLKLKSNEDKQDDKAKVQHHDEGGKKFAKPAVKENMKANTKGAKKVAGVRKTGTA